MVWLDDQGSIDTMAAMRCGVVGRLLGPRRSLDYVRRVVTTNTKWKLASDPVVQPFGDRLFLFRLACEEDVRKVLDDGAWVVGG